LKSANALQARIPTAYVVTDDGVAVPDGDCTDDGVDHRNGDYHQEYYQDFSVNFSECTEIVHGC
jgi:hypothetical protein